MRNYFGTDTRSAGHYFWLLKGDSQTGSSLDDFKNSPFNPEEFTKIAKYAWKPKGSVEFHYIEGYSICAITGSPIDSRMGCKSVFFFKEDLNQEQLIDKIKSIPAAMKIINQMPFDVEFFKTHHSA